MAAGDGVLFGGLGRGVCDDGRVWGGEDVCCGAGFLGCWVSFSGSVLCVLLVLGTEVGRWPWRGGLLWIGF